MINAIRYFSGVGKSQKFTDNENAVVTGELILKGVTKSIAFDVVKIGEGQASWGGYRAGFSGTICLKLSDYDISYI